ncbi:MAG: response regulator [Rhizobiales bacterium]|nr:response regulator [Hyphomicrobiales bacterium]
MLNNFTIIGVALTYLGILFVVASYADTHVRRQRMAARNSFLRPLIYTLSFGVYCTSWTFFGSVGLAAHSGLDFLPIYIGPILMFIFGWPIVRRVVELSKQHNITSIADFIAARYGKSQALGATVAVIAVIGTLPYISLQLKATTFSLEAMLGASSGGEQIASFLPMVNDLALPVAIAMGAFTVLFGTRHIDATEHQDGLMTAIAVESIVKLLAFLVVGLFATYSVLGGFSGMFSIMETRPEIGALFTRDLDGGRWLTLTVLSMFAILLLPRQFHVTVVENDDVRDLKTARWLFPLYLIAINLFVVPIAIAGLVTFSPGTIDADTYVLALPVNSGQTLVTVIAFLGGLSAATAMVIVATMALSIMVCNDLVVPIILRNKLRGHAHKDMGGILLRIRRISIFAILALAYSYYWMVSDSAALVQTGLISFAAIAQFAPAFFGAMIWRRATARGAMAGILAGSLMWVYTLLLPSFIDAGWFSATILTEGPYGFSLLRPRVLFGLEFDPLTHGVLWSLLTNLAAYVAFSVLWQPKPIERLQASAFASTDVPGASPSFRLWSTAIFVGDLKETVARYLGEARTERSFAEFAQSRSVVLDNEAEADIRLLRFAEHLLASAVGAASSRLVVALLLERHSHNSRGAMKLLDDASAAIQYNRELLQSAIDHVGQGIAVFDKDLNLTCWNQQFRHLLHLPPDIGRVGVPLHEVVHTIAENTGLSEGNVDDAVSARIDKLIVSMQPYQEYIAQAGRHLDVKSDSLPDGGIVITFTDITERVEAAEELTRVNESLERRVEERTAELTNLNTALARAKADADAANLGKTSFIAAASHDILQPLNAARLFTTSLREDLPTHPRRAELVGNIDASLEAVEDILSALLDISKLDAGALKAEKAPFKIDEILKALEIEFGALARDKGLRLTVVPCSATVFSDRRLVRRILQNLLSNAIKYTPAGRVLMGCKRDGDTIRVEVYDTGPGIAPDQQQSIIKEFHRLASASGTEPGLGLGLSIVDRIAKMLGHTLALRSEAGNGSMFALSLPLTDALAIRPPTRSQVSSIGNDLRGLRVLCIDNEPKILDGMTTLLGGWGCIVGTARDAAEALRSAEGGVDVIIADYHLDDQQNGLDLIAQLRAETGTALPAVLITADQSSGLRDQAGQQDVHLMRKPLKPAALRALLVRSRVKLEAAE